MNQNNIRELHKRYKMAAAHETNEERLGLKQFKVKWHTYHMNYNFNITTKVGASNAKTAYYSLA